MPQFLRQAGCPKYFGPGNSRPRAITVECPSGNAGSRIGSSLLGHVLCHLAYRRPENPHPNFASLPHSRSPVPRPPRNDAPRRCSVIGTSQYWAGYCSDEDECPDTANGDESPYAMTINGTNVTVSNQLV